MRAGRGSASVCACLLTVLAASASHAQVAMFRVTDSQLLKDGKTARVTIHWTYNSGTNSTYTGEGVKFFINTKLVDRFVDKKELGTPLTDTVDMKNGSGFATITVPLPKGTGPGSDLVLIGEWQSGHRWGCDPSRAGGEFKLPTSPTGGLRVNINSATAAELGQIPGVSTALAKRIVSFRDQLKTKRFGKVDDLAKVKGITDKTLAQLSPYLTIRSLRPKVPPMVNINRAAANQLAAIPGLSPKLARAIVDHRAQLKKDPSHWKRRFSYPSDLSQVPGIDQALASKLMAYVRFDGRSTGVPRAQRNSLLGSQWRPPVGAGWRTPVRTGWRPDGVVPPAAGSAWRSPHSLIRSDNRASRR